MTLRDMMASDAETVFCNVNDFAEAVTYYPRQAQSRPINAVVVRDPLALFGPDGDDVLPVFEVHVQNDSVLGISSDELNQGGDSLEFPVRIGQPNSVRTITRLISHDDAMLVLECR